MSVTEPLDKLSRFTFDWSDTLCDPAHGCCDYHRMWSLVRLVETGGTLPEGSDFFYRELRKSARPDGVRVLLSGAADTGLSAIAAGAFCGQVVPLTVVMADRCRTPLEQARLYALSAGFHLETQQGTLDQIVTEPVDAIMAHSFLAFIPPADRPALFAAWSRLLRSGGRVLLSQRLQPEDSDYTRKRPPVEIAERRAELGRKLEKSNPVSAPIATILNAAERLWLNPMGGNPIKDSELRAFCDDAGMDVTEVCFDDDLSTSTSPFALRSQALTRKRAEIVIVKR